MISCPDLSLETFHPHDEILSLGADDNLKFNGDDLRESIAEIKKVSGAAIKTSRDPQTGQRSFLIHGFLVCVETAKDMILDKLTKPVTITFKIPSWKRSLVVGEKGKTVKALNRKFGVRIKAERKTLKPGWLQYDVVGFETPMYTDTNDQEERFVEELTVSIAGSRLRCERAKARILELLELKDQYRVTLLKTDSVIWKDFFDEQFCDNTISVFTNEYKDLIRITLRGDAEPVANAKRRLDDMIFVQLVKYSVLTVTVTHPVETSELKSIFLVKIHDKYPQYQIVGLRDRVLAARHKLLQYPETGFFFSMNLAEYQKQPALHNLYHFIKLYELRVILKDDYIVHIPRCDDEQLYKDRLISIVKNFSPDDVKAFTDFHPLLLKHFRGRLRYFLSRQLPYSALYRHDVCKKQITLITKYTLSENQPVHASQEERDRFEEGVNQIREYQNRCILKVLQIPRHQHRLIEGPNGTTLSSIMSMFEDDRFPDEKNVHGFWCEICLDDNKHGLDLKKELSRENLYIGRLLKIELGFNEMERSADSITIFGPESDVVKAENAIMQVLSDRDKISFYQTMIEVPSILILRVVSVRYLFWLCIRKKFGVKLSILDNGKESRKIGCDFTSRTRILIKGIKFNVERAKDRILERSKNFEDRCFAIVEVDSRYNLRICGPNYSNLKQIMDEYGVCIDNGKRGLCELLEKNEVGIVGPLKRVELAAECLKDLYLYVFMSSRVCSVDPGTVPIEYLENMLCDNYLMDSENDISCCGCDFRLIKSTNEQTYADAVELQGDELSLRYAKERIEDIKRNFVTMKFEVSSSVRDRIDKEIKEKLLGLTDVQRSFALNVTRSRGGQTTYEIVSQGHRRDVIKVAEEIERIVAEEEAGSEIAQ